jgi:hypothetical protein
MSLVFSVKENLEGHRYKVDRTFENNCDAMTDIYIAEFYQQGNKEDRLTTRKIS